jgi:hypothetical protein
MNTVPADLYLTRMRVATERARVEQLLHDLRLAELGLVISRLPGAEREILQSSISSSRATAQQLLKVLFDADVTAVANAILSERAVSE